MEQKYNNNLKQKLNDDKKKLLEEDDRQKKIKNNILIYNRPRNYAHKYIYKENMAKNNFNINEIEDNSFDDEKVLNKKIEFKDTEFSNLVNDLIKENPLENLSKIEDINKMIIFTKDNIIKFLNCQQDYNIKIRKAFDIYDDYFKLMKKYSQKYANKIKILKILEKKQKINEIIKSLNRNSIISNIFRIVEIKNNENDFYKYITDNDNNVENDFEENLNINDINNNNNDKNIYNNNYNILYDLIKNCYINYGKNENIIKIFPKNILEKYKLENNDNKKEEDNILNVSLVDNDENILEENNNNDNENKSLLYVESKINDEIDFELDSYLKEFYNNNKNIPIIKFKKIHDNNYKYGKTQIILIEEGDKIKIKDDNGIFSLENYLEINSRINN